MPTYKPNSLAVKAPWLEKEWHPDNDKKFWEVSYGSGEKYNWVCKYGHVWPASPSNRSASKNPTGCPECSGHRVSVMNSLATKAPWLEREWHSGNTKKFHEVSYGSDQKRKWSCSRQHTYWASPCNRTGKQQSSCPRCSKLHSKVELDIFGAVKNEYPDAVNGQRRLLESRGLELDIYVPSLKKAIEYDGTYWHAFPAVQVNDARKNEQCIQAGIQLLRISEAEYKADPIGTITKALEWLKAES